MLCKLYVYFSPNECAPQINELNVINHITDRILFRDEIAQDIMFRDFFSVVPSAKSFSISNCKFIRRIDTWKNDRIFSNNNYNSSSKSIYSLFDTKFEMWWVIFRRSIEHTGGFMSSLDLISLNNNNNKKKQEKKKKMRKNSQAPKRRWSAKKVKKKKIKRERALMDRWSSNDPH